MKPSKFPIYFAHDYRYHQMKTIVYCRKNFMQVCGCMYMCVCVYVYVYICVHYCRLVIKYHQLTLQANNYINLWLHNYKQKNIYCGGRWNLSKKDFIEIPETVGLIIKWWALRFERLYSFDLLIFSFKMLN